MTRKLMYSVVLGSILLFGTAAAQAVTVELSSPQEGTEVQPGATVEMTVTVTNDAAIKDCVAVSLKLVAEGIQHPVVAKGWLRLKLEPGETVTRTIALVVPAALKLPGPVPATLQADASGNKTQTEATDSVSLTLVPIP
jgi:hypothetical protein